jgi:hypothetical protein
MVNNFISVARKPINFLGDSSLGWWVKFLERIFCGWKEGYSIPKLSDFCYKIKPQPLRMRG